jgi:hypothetical protein
MTSPARRREAVSRVQEPMGIPERHACRALEQPRSSQRCATQTSVQEEPVVRGHRADGQVRSAGNGTTQVQEDMSVVGKCAAEKAEWAISKFDGKASFFKAS